MKRFLIATALTASMASAAFAASEAEMAEINSYMPNVDVSMMSDEQVAQAMQIINSGMGRSETVSQLEGLVTTNDMSGPATLSEAEMAELQRVAPEADLTAITQAQADQAMQLLTSGNSSDVHERVREILMPATGTSGMAMPTEAQQVQLEKYLTEAQIGSMTEAELAQAMQIVTSGDGEGAKKNKLEGLVN